MSESNMNSVEYPSSNNNNDGTQPLSLHRDDKNDSRSSFDEESPDSIFEAIRDSSSSSFEALPANEEVLRSGQKESSENGTSSQEKSFGNKSDIKSATSSKAGSSKSSTYSAIIAELIAKCENDPNISLPLPHDATRSRSNSTTCAALHPQPCSDSFLAALLGLDNVSNPPSSGDLLFSRLLQKNIDPPPASENVIKERKFKDHKKSSYRFDVKKCQETRRLHDIFDNLKWNLTNMTHQGTYVSDALRTKMFPRVSVLLKTLSKCREKKWKKKSILLVLGFIPYSAGINNMAFTTILKPLVKLGKGGRMCMLLFDEISIRENYSYDPSADIIYGFEDRGNSGRRKANAKFAIVFMVCGVLSNWKLPIATYFWSTRVKSGDLVILLKEVLQKCLDYRLNVSATVCDLAVSKVMALKALGSTLNKPYIHFHGQKIVTIYDPTRLVLSTRDLFLQSDILVPIILPGSRNQARASWKHLVALHEHDKLNRHKKNYSITEDHLRPRGKKKIDICLAIQSFSNAVAASIHHKVSSGNMPAECLATSHFIWLIFNMLNSMNGFRYRTSGFKQIDGAKAGDTEFWSKAYGEVKSWKFFNKLGNTSSNSPFLSRSLLCQRGWLVTLSGLMLIWAKLRRTEKLLAFFGYICFTLEPLEQLFSSIRTQSGSENDPTAAQFVDGFKTYLIKTLASKDLTPGNGFFGVTVSLLGNMQTYLKSDGKGTMKRCVCPESMNVNAENAIKAVKKVISCTVPVKSTADLCMNIFKRIRIKKCPNCRAALQTVETDHSEADIFFGKQGNVNYPSEKLVESIGISVNLIEDFLNINAHEVGIAKKIACKVELEFSWLKNSCENHFKEITKKILAVMIPSVISWWCKRKNLFFVLERQKTCLEKEKKCD